MRDEFFWLGQMNKATIVTNTKLGLLSEELAKKAAKGVQTVLDAGDADPANRVSRVIQFEPKLIAAAGPEVTVIHVGRSSQDMHSTYRATMMRDNVLHLARHLETTMVKLVELAEEHNISDPEDLGRLRNSIQLMADWMDKGMEVYASIQAPEETKAVFPPIEKQTLPEGIIGLLTEGTDSTS